MYYTKCYITYIWFLNKRSKCSEEEIISMPLDFTLIRKKKKKLFHTESMDSILEFYDKSSSAERFDFFAEILHLTLHVI